MSISQRLYLILSVMVLLISAELTALWFTIHTLSAVRAYVGGEGLWSKAEKDAVYHLEVYGRTQNEKDYQAYLTFLGVPLGDREARVEMAKAQPDQQREVEGFLQGRNEASDIPGMIALFQRFNRVSYISDAIADWIKADGLLGQIQTLGTQLHQEVHRRQPAATIDRTLDRISAVNHNLTYIEDQFSFTLGEGSRWLTDLVLKILLGAALTVELSGLVLTASVTSGISRRLKEMLSATDRISRGDFNVSLPTRSNDEIGQLSTAFVRMAADIEREQARAEAAMRTTEAALREAQRVAHIGSWEWNIFDDTVSCSRELLRLCGLSDDRRDVQYEDFIAFVHPDDRVNFELSIQRARSGAQAFSIDCRLAPHAGCDLWVCFEGSTEVDAYGKVARVMGTMLDITDRKLSEERFVFLAQHDALTGLPNRTLFMERLSSAVTRARRNGAHGALLFLDLDHFKTFNDTLGHASGDRMLASVAKRLQSSVRSSDTVARSGGDEFLVVLADLESASTARTVARSILDSLAQPFAIDGRVLFMTASIGVSLFPTDADVEVLIRDADTAMYEAKKQGRNNFQFFTSKMHDEATQRLALRNELRRALDEHQFEVHYQPMIDLASGMITGAEALVRWRDPERGLRLPGEFIGAAEEAGLIVRLGEWVLREACGQIRRWQDAGYAKLRMAVNVSSIQLCQPDFPALIASIVRSAEIEPSALELEITETSVTADTGTLPEVLLELRTMGIGITLDDFGTGYSSLNHLKHFPIVAIKIDRSFVADIAGDTFDKAIAESMVSLCHKVGLRITAEGVETRAQLDLLRKVGCDEIQGHCVSPAVEPLAFEALLERWKRAAVVRGDFEHHDRTSVQTSG